MTRWDPFGGEFSGPSGLQYGDIADVTFCVQPDYHFETLHVKLWIFPPRGGTVRGETEWTGSIAKDEARCWGVIVELADTGPVSCLGRPPDETYFVILSTSLTAKVTGDLSTARREPSGPSVSEGWAEASQGDYEVVYGHGLVPRSGPFTAGPGDACHPSSHPPASGDGHSGLRESDR